MLTDTDVLANRLSVCMHKAKLYFICCMPKNWSLDPFYMVAYYMKRVETSCTHSINSDIDDFVEKRKKLEVYAYYLNKRCQINFLWQGEGEIPSEENQGSDRGFTRKKRTRGNLHYTALQVGKNKNIDLGEKLKKGKEQREEIE